MSSIHVVISTIDSFQAAQELANRIVSERLAACVNILPSISSVYRWKETIQQDQECLLILKTATDRVGALVDGIISLHPYEVPEVIAFPVHRGHQAYIDWVLETTEAV